MPTYDYKCSACGHQWELFQSIKADPIKKCPECGKQRAKRIIGAGAGVIFRGSGFFQIDYRSDSYKKDAAADKKSQSASDGKSDKGSSDSKSSSSESKSSSSEKKSKPSGD